MLRFALSQASNLSRRFRRSAGGNVAIVLGLSLPFFLALGGGGVDVYRASVEYGALQDAADASALAGARQYSVYPGSSITPSTVASNYMTTNFSSLSIDSSSYVTNDLARTVDVTVSSNVVGVFSPLVGLGNIPIRAHAKALGTQMGTPVCMLALNSSASGAISLGGSTSLDASPCTVWVNSSSSSAISMTGASNVTASKTCIVGGSSKTITPTPKNCGVKTDPFSTMSPSASGACNYYSGTYYTNTLSPGVYCGNITLSASGTVTMQPGTYYLRNGAFSVSGSPTIDGTAGVTIVLEGSSTLNMSGAGTINLNAQTSGEYSGFVIYQRQTATAGLSTTLSGSGKVNYQGVAYLPLQTVSLQGNSGVFTTSPLSSFIADKFVLGGNSTIGFNYQPSNVTVPVPSGAYDGLFYTRLSR